VVITEMVAEKLLSGFGGMRAAFATVRLWDGTVTSGRSKASRSTLSAHQHSCEHVLLQQDEQAYQ
jgi:hypothetical protein